MNARRLPSHPTLLAMPGSRVALLAALALALLLVALLALGGSRDPSAGVVIAEGPPVQVGSRQPGSLPAQAAESNSTGGQPRAQIPAAFHNFGRVAPDAVVQRDFFIINRGDGPLVIQAAYTTCGCTTAELSSAAIPPGQGARATITFDAGFHSLSGGTVRRGLILETNDPDQPMLEIWVQAEVAGE